MGDNSKKYTEIAGALGGKYVMDENDNKIGVQKTYEATVIGDTVGDPFKDTSGPALNILLKLMAVVALVMSTYFQDEKDWKQWYIAIVPLFFIVVVTIVMLSVTTARRPTSHEKPKSPKKKMPQAIAGPAVPPET